MKLKHKVIISIVILIIGIYGATAYINYRISIEAAQNQLKNVSLPLSVDNIYSAVQKNMVEPLLISSLMASDTFMRDWMLNGEKNINLISKYLRKIQNKYKLFTTFLVSNKTLNYYHPRGLIEVLNKKNYEDRWFFNFKKNKNLYEVNLDYNKNLGKDLIIFINYKVFDYKNRFIGVTGVGLKLSNIENMLDTFKKRYHYDVYFLDKRGEIIIHSKTLNKRGNISDLPGLKLFKKAILSHDELQFSYKDESDEYLVNTKYIKELNLYMAVEANKKEYLELFRKTLYFNIFVSLLITVLVVLIIVYIINMYQKRLEKQAQEDALTKIFNRRKFNEAFEYLYGLFCRKGIENLILIIIDIDNFKKINDSLGHLGGDKVLERIGAILKNWFRKSDMVARWGGEEFAVMLVNTPKDRAARLAEKLRIAIKEDEALMKILGKSLTVSLGLAEMKNGDSEDALIQKADKALYEAKRKGKDRLVVD